MSPQIALCTTKETYTMRNPSCRCQRAFYPRNFFVNVRTHTRAHTHAHARTQTHTHTHTHTHAHTHTTHTHVDATKDLAPETALDPDLEALIDTDTDTDTDG